MIYTSKVIIVHKSAPFRKNDLTRSSIWICRQFWSIFWMFPIISTSAQQVNLIFVMQSDTQTTNSSLISSRYQLEGSLPANVFCRWIFISKPRVELIQPDSDACFKIDKWFILFLLQLLVKYLIYHLLSRVYYLSSIIQVFLCFTRYFDFVS